MTPRPVLVVDVANVMGSRADGWWRDRAGAARRLVDEVRSGLTDDHDVVLVLEGAARDGLPASEDHGMQVVHAEGHGDDAVVAQTRDQVRRGLEVVVVTADRVLRERVTALGAACRGPRWLLDRLA